MAACRPQTPAIAARLHLGAAIHGITVDARTEGFAMAQPAQLFAILRRFASTMVDTFEMDDVLYEFGDSAATVRDAAGAGVSVVTEEGTLRFVTATSETVVEIAVGAVRHHDGFDAIAGWHGGADITGAHTPRTSA